MNYTGKGDKGKSNLINPKNRITKSSPIFEVLGSLDELNSYLGLCLVEAKNFPKIQEIIVNIQNQLYISQAYFAEAKIDIPADLLTKTEKTINQLSQSLEPKRVFVLSGGSRLSALFDVARTLARRSERVVVQLQDSQNKPIDSLILAYLNRLSSLLYVLARLANHLNGQTELAAKYN